MKIQKMYVKSVGAYQTGMFVELENWVCPQSLLKDVHQYNPHLDMEECYIKTSICIDEEEPVSNVILFVPCSKVEFI